MLEKSNRIGGKGVCKPITAPITEYSIFKHCVIENTLIHDFRIYDTPAKKAHFFIGPIKTMTEQRNSGKLSICESATLYYTRPSESILQNYLQNSCHTDLMGKGHNRGSDSTSYCTVSRNNTYVRINSIRRNSPWELHCCKRQYPIDQPVC